MAAGVTRKDDSPAHQRAGTAGTAAAAPPGRRQRGAGWRAQTTLALAVCLAGAGWAPRGAHAQKGYDKEERETGIWTGQFATAQRTPRRRDHATSVAAGGGRDAFSQRPGCLLVPGGSKCPR